ncbi:MAG: sugar phosphate isomerase/epimerase [Thermofilaceae archaeon]|nr:sugar phosphate isomerase/epimerase [Thermofilaceae archaeon]MCX8180049.1 sugar phosphate isomerase/epimerase [Thermofilaceae archaeon]MDW8003208.1 sugar phosphate isomerase/epimerase family protein [Thermofilaceae archaeon]
MKLSIQENLVPGLKLEEKLIKAERFGFDGVEVWGHGMRERIEEIKQALSTVKIRISTICSGYRGDLLSANWEERRIAVQDLGELLGFAAQLEATGVITVPTFGGPKLPDLRPLYSSVWELERALLMTELRELSKVAEDVGVHVLLEPLNRYETHFLCRLEQAVCIAEEIGSPGIAVMADFFHMNIEESDIAEALRRSMKYLRHIHLADSNRWLPGFGHTDFRTPFKVLKEGGYNRYMTLECYVPEPKEENILKSIQYLRSLI